MSVACERCASRLARFWSRYATTSTSQVISSSGVPSGLPSSIGSSGFQSQSETPAARASSNIRVMAVRFMVDSSSRGVRRASGAARCTRWWTLTWSGCP